MDKELEYYENIALSDHDVLQLLNGKVHIELYPNIYKYNTLDELLGRYSACILLFEAKPKYGHWVLIFKLNKDEVEFFNPYGGYPDDSLMHIDTEFRKSSNQIFPKLSELLLDSPYELFSNEFEIQGRGKYIKTCGRHCVVRLINRNLDIYEYMDMLDNIKKKTKMNYDEIVTYITI